MESNPYISKHLLAATGSTPRKVQPRYATIEEAKWDDVPDVDIPFVVDGLTPSERAQYSPLITVESGPFKGRQYRRDPLTKSLVRV